MSAKPMASYLKKSLAATEFEYSNAEINDEIETIDAESLKNLPVGANGLEYQWLDLDGEGLQCVLAEQQGGWHYKRNVSPISTVNENGKEKVVARFEPLIEVTTQPSTGEAASGAAPVPRSRRRRKFGRGPARETSIRFL